MIVINDVIFETMEHIEFLLKEMRENAYKEELVESAEIFQDYIKECYIADAKLQQMVTENLSDEYISFTIIPTQDTEILDTFNFKLWAEDGVKIKKREELLYDQYCEICFGNIETYYSRLVRYYNEHH